MTATQLAARRHARIMSGRARARARAKRRGAVAERAERDASNRSWLAGLGAAHEDGAAAADARHQQALASRRSDAAMPGHTPRGWIGRLRSLFRRSP